MADPKELAKALMGHGRDFLQSASNSAASNVSAPVDGLAWALRKAGVPMPAKPFMGSDWMADKGLTRPVAHSPASVLGETASMLAPFGVAAKAPQIAKGLLQMGENAMVPRALNKQAGAVVWHGSPHKFDAFDAGKIGTGEGAQAYGHGLYLADSPSVAEAYSRSVTQQKMKDMHGFNMARDSGATSSAIDYFNAMKTGAAPKDLDPFGKAVSNRYIDEQIAGLTQQLTKEHQALGNGNFTPSIYKVDLPDEHIAKMLDWDKPLSGQNINSPIFASAQKSSLDALPSSFGPNDTPLDVANEIVNGKTGAQVYDLLKMQHGADKASSIMREAGIPGIKYLDGGSRATGGTSNYVVFPGNESMLNILERNGQAIK